MRMRIALSALVTAIVALVTIGGNVTAANAATSALSSFQEDQHCC